MTAFTPMGFRKTRIFGTRGMLEGDGYAVDVFDFLTGRTTSTQVVDPSDLLAGEGHLGADAALTRASWPPYATVTRAASHSPRVSLHTHEIVWAAERARRTGGSRAGPTCQHERPPCGHPR